MNASPAYSRARYDGQEKKITRSLLWALAALCALSFPSQSLAANGALTLTVENDVFTGTDNNYTNGIGITWVSAALGTYKDDSYIREWADFWSFLPFVSDQGAKAYVSWSITQEMNTPDTVLNPNPPEDDQPYSGILYVDNDLYVREGRWTHAWELKLGMVGPATKADQVQASFHRVIGANKPMGWHTQLPNEPIVNAGYTGAYLLAQGPLSHSATWRMVPVANVGLGNYFTGVGLGMYGEAGWNLPDALGGTALRSGLNAASTVGAGPVHGWSVGFFGGLAEYGIARYLPLDGTLFRSSRSVNTEPFVGMATFGVSARHRNFVLSFSETYFTKLFETERHRTDFGTFSLSDYF